MQYELQRGAKRITGVMRHQARQLPEPSLPAYFRALTREEVRVVSTGGTVSSMKVELRQLKYAFKK